MIELQFFGQIFLAMILGAMLGLQRERWGKSAGPRTYGLVASGAALFTILSVNAFGLNASPYVAAQVVTGIGFLVAGLIIKHDDHIEGLTTAAGLWMMAAIGMAVGVGYYILSVACTILILALLMLDDRRFRRKQDGQ